MFEATRSCLDFEKFDRMYKDQRIQAEKETYKTQDSILEDSEEETAELLSRDPKDWKDQDHYAVLGLSKYRWRATEEQIKLAHRKKVLKHHPDKKASSGNMNDDAFFKCIQKAHEILSDPVKRRQYDSIDQEIDDSPPSLKTKGDFFEIYGPVFEREARFSNKTPVPLLGDINTTKEELEAFYDFWYKFDSWRSFEYLDKEDADSTDNRDDKRYLEKKNKAERARRKKEDNTRLRKIVGMEAAEEEKRRQEEAEAEAKQKQLEEKKGKAAKKKALRNERKNIKNFLKEQNYFYPNNENPPVDVIDVQLSELDVLLENMSVEELQHLKNQLTDAKSKGDAKNVLKKEAKRLLKTGILAADEKQSWKNTNVRKTLQKMLRRWETISEYVAYHAGLPPRRTIALDDEAVRKLQHQKKHADSRITEDPSIREATINYDDPILLANENKSDPSKSKSKKKSTINKTTKSTYAENDSNKKNQVTKENGTGSAIKPEDLTVSDEISPSTIVSSSISTSTTNNTSATTWTAEQQAQLERALQAYPPDWKGNGDRWENITNAVEGKTKKECKLRVKYLVEQVKAKKAASGGK
ncbi:8089_t:CDS:10 [Ambispora leptoticha]|uniref:8089_t:CDS:1 n=1 Tax=Ambispora leptoticha TaxID=144679 RepID=A0A9N8VCG5_9GLOM|nr:8089_t:CDS:10 [Ambispora leptoticha]